MKYDCLFITHNGEGAFIYTFVIPHGMLPRTMTLPAQHASWLQSVRTSRTNARPPCTRTFERLGINLYVER